jgi:capsular exopolysaccharide synthesis family protein
MSRICQALQRVGCGSLLPWSSSPHALLQSAVQNIDEFDDFPSIRVSVSPESRLVSLTDRESLGAEKFRFLGVRLRQLQQTRPLKKVLITSTIADEGKSVVSVNLATTLARKQHERVLLIDGDLRRSVLAQRLGIGDRAGISEWLQSDTPTVTNIYHLDTLGFWFMPAGRSPENPVELMQSGRLPHLFERLSTWFDWIVIDAPPVLPLADTSVWARMADGVLLVTREGKTEKQELQRGLRTLEQGNLLGVILNSCSDADHSNYYQRYRPEGKRFLLTGELFSKAATALAAAAVLAVLLDVSIHRFSPLPAGLSQPPEDVQQQAPFQRTKHIVTVPVESSSVGTKTVTTELSAASKAAVPTVRTIESGQRPESRVSPVSAQKTIVKRDHLHISHVTETDMVAEDTVVHYGTGSAAPRSLAQRKP